MKLREREIISRSLLIEINRYLFFFAVSVVVELGGEAIAMARPDERAGAEDVVREELSTRLARLLPLVGE